MAGSAPLTPVETLFKGAGKSRTLSMALRLSIVSSVKAMSHMARLASGWPSEAFDEEAEEGRPASRVLIVWRPLTL